MKRSEAKKFIGIISTIQEEGFLSIGTAMRAYEDIGRKYGLREQVLIDTINKVHKEVDEGSSTASVDLYFKDGESYFF